MLPRALFERLHERLLIRQRTKSAAVQNRDCDPRISGRTQPGPTTVGEIRDRLDAMAPRPPSRMRLLATLRAHEAELRARGIEAITLFGSVARGEAGARSDVDLAIRPGATFSAGGFDYFGQIENLREHLVALLGCEVDLVEEPPRDQRLKQVIEREGVRAF
jgi:predicted nucleotidyltransferase